MLVKPQVRWRICCNKLLQVLVHFLQGKSTSLYVLIFQSTRLSPITRKVSFGLLFSTPVIGIFNPSLRAARTHLKILLDSPILQHTPAWWCYSQWHQELSFFNCLTPFNVISLVYQNPLGLHKLKTHIVVQLLTQLCLWTNS